MKRGPVVYLIHFNYPLGNSRHAAWHYVGFTLNYHGRMWSHRTGQSRAKIMRAIYERRIGWNVGKVWPGAGRDFERLLKRRGHYDRYCEICHERGKVPPPPVLPTAAQVEASIDLLF